LARGRGEQQAMAPQIGGVDLAAHESGGLKPFQIESVTVALGMLIVAASSAG
jgi:hypothetical protein